MPEGQWTPPDAGDAPQEVKDILKSVYSSCRDKDPAETPEAKEKCSKISWGAVKQAGWSKDAEGKWVKTEKEGNLTDLASDPGDISSFHDVTLQRLDVYQTNNGSKVLYPEQHFSNAADWKDIPVIYQRTRDGKPGKHPDFTAVTNGTLNPEEYAVVGYVNVATLADAGEPALRSEIAFSNPKCTLAAQARELSLSTGFSAPIANLDDGKRSIAGRVIPNHVLIFKRGSCPNCYPNDNGAKFENLRTLQQQQHGSDQMTNDKQTARDKIFEMFKNLGTALFTNKDYPWDQCMADATKEYGDEETAKKVCGKIKAQNNQESETMTDEIAKKATEELTNMTAERDALKAKLSELTNLNEAYKKANDEAKVAFENVVKENADLKWTLVRNILPKAWVDTPEHETATRKEYTETPHAFAAKLAQHMNQMPPEKKAEGETVTNQSPATSDDWGELGATKKGGK